MKAIACIKSQVKKIIAIKIKGRVSNGVLQANSLGFQESKLLNLFKNKKLQKRSIACLPWLSKEKLITAKPLCLA